MGIGKRGREHKGRAGTTLASRAHQGTFQRTQVAAGEREGWHGGRVAGKLSTGQRRE